MTTVWLLRRFVLLSAVLYVDSRASTVADDVQRAAEALGAGPGEAAVFRNGNLTGERAWILRDGDGWRRLKKSPFKLYDADGTQLRSLAACAHRARHEGAKRQHERPLCEWAKDWMHWLRLTAQ